MASQPRNSVGPNSWVTVGTGAAVCTAFLYGAMWISNSFAETRLSIAQARGEALLGASQINGKLDLLDSRVRMLEQSVSEKK